MSKMWKAQSIGTAAAATAALGVAYRHAMSGYRPSVPSAGLAVLTPKEQVVVAACADAFFPPGGPIARSGTEAGLVAYMDGYVAALPPTQILLARLLFHFIEHLPWVVGRARFSKLDQEGRLEVLATMRTSPIYFLRVAFLSMRTMLTMGYLTHPDVRAAMGMHGDPDPFGLGRTKMKPTSSDNGEAA